MTEDGVAQGHRRDAAWFEVASRGETAYRLRLGGLLRTEWLAALCNRLARHHISVDHAHARLTHGETWIGELHLVALPGAPDPLGLPYVELTEDDDAAPAAVLSLSTYQLLESHDHGGTLKLTLEAPDALGLLGSLLASLASLALFPIEVHIETRSGRAYDSLWLAAAGHAAPSAETRDALEGLLASSVRPPEG